MDAAKVLDLSRRFIVRALTADFQREHASDEERSELAAFSTPVVDPLAQDYLAWRRSALWVSAVVLTIGVVIAVADHKPIAEGMAEGWSQPGMQLTVEQVTQGIGPKNIEMLDDLQYFMLLLKGCIAAMVYYAAKSWRVVKRSRTVARYAWLVALIVPIMVMAWPWSKTLDFSHLDQINEFGQRMKQQGEMLHKAFGTLFAVMSLATIAPKIFALFPGIMRSSLILKTLLPEATAPGWFTVVFAPFMSGFLLLVLCLLSQVEGSYLAIAGVVLLAIGPCVYVRRARDLVRPHSAEEIHTVVHGMRKQALAFSGSGLVLLLIYLFAESSLSKVTIAHLLVEAFGSILLTMVAISDITLALLSFSQVQGAKFQTSELREGYERRLQSLGTAGLTDVEGALGVNDLAELRNRP
jgi:hypothetical protein